MSKFIEVNSNEKNSISDTVRTSDYISEQILNVISSIKAREDCINFVETRFNE